MIYTTYYYCASSGAPNQLVEVEVEAKIHCNNTHIILTQYCEKVKLVFLEWSSPTQEEIYLIVIFTFILVLTSAYV